MTTPETPPAVLQVRDELSVLTAKDRRRRRRALRVVVLLLLAALLAAGATLATWHYAAAHIEPVPGPAGPAGPAGRDGRDGVDGAPGERGGSSWCARVDDPDTLAPAEWVPIDLDSDGHHDFYEMRCISRDGYPAE